MFHEEIAKCHALYLQIMHGDVYMNWKTVTRLANIEGDGIERKKVHRVNLLISLWLLASAVRFGSMFFGSGSLPTFVIGHTLFLIGSWAKMVGVVASVVLAECACLRLAGRYLSSTNRMIFLDTVKQVVNEGDGDLRQRKLNMTRNVLIAVLIVIPTIIGDRLLFYTSMLVYNLHSASSVWEVGCWIFWYLADLTAPILVATDLMLFPAMWIIVVLNHRMDMRHLIHRLDSLSEAPAHARSARFSSLAEQYVRLIHRSVSVNSFSAPILFVVSLFAPPLFCTVLFTLQYFEGQLITGVIMAAAVPIEVGVAALLSTAASLTSTAEELHSALCRAACDPRLIHTLTSDMKLQLFKMIEETGAETTQLALYTLDGQKYTTEMLLYFAIELGLDYTLLLTLNGSLTLV